MHRQIWLVVAKGHVEFRGECLRELYRLDAVNDDVLEVMCAIEH